MTQCKLCHDLKGVVPLRTALRELCWVCERCDARASLEAFADEEEIYV